MACYSLHVQVNKIYHDKAYYPGSTIFLVGSQTRREGGKREDGSRGEGGLVEQRERQGKGDFSTPFCRPEKETWHCSADNKPPFSRIFIQSSAAAL